MDENDCVHMEETLFARCGGGAEEKWKKKKKKERKNFKRLNVRQNRNLNMNRFGLTDYDGTTDHLNDF